MKKNKISKEAKKLDKKLKELGKFTKRRPTLINSSESYQFHTPDRETSNQVEKKQEHTRWVLINQQGQLVGRLDYNPLNTRESARKWFYDTRRMVNKHGNFDDLYRVLTNDEFEELKKGKRTKTKLVDLLSRAPISFDDREEE